MNKLTTFHSDLINISDEKWLYQRSLTDDVTLIPWRLAHDICLKDRGESAFRALKSWASSAGKIFLLKSETNTPRSVSLSSSNLRNSTSSMMMAASTSNCCPFRKNSSQRRAVVCGLKSSLNNVINHLVVRRDTLRSSRARPFQSLGMSMRTLLSISAFIYSIFASPFESILA